MVDDFLLMQQVQDVLARYPLQPVGGSLTELAGQVDLHRVQVTIPSGFPDEAPEIYIDGVKSVFCYAKRIPLVDCIASALQVEVIPVSFPEGCVTAPKLSSEDWFMEEIQQVLSRYPDIHPVGGDLRHLQGHIINSMEYESIEINIPENYPDQPAQIFLGRDVGFGSILLHSQFASHLADAIERIQQKIIQSRQYPSPTGTFGMNPTGNYHNILSSMDDKQDDSISAQEQSEPVTSAPVSNHYMRTPSEEQGHREPDTGLHTTVYPVPEHQIPAANTQQSASQSGNKSGKTLWGIIGGISLLLGIYLYIGNTTGTHPTFPYAGFIVMSVGVVIISWALRG
jgi:hypothetical protein